MSTAPEFTGDFHTTGLNGSSEAGMDLRDGGASMAAQRFPFIRLSELIKKLAGEAAKLVGIWFVANVAVDTIANWDVMPDWIQLLVQDEFEHGVGVMNDGSGTGLPAVMGHQVPHLIDGHLGAHIIGSWVANGVTFYRLSDGKLAVQSKHGKWKVWRPKKPIVIMPGGVGSIRTLLRADAVITRQSKKLANMLNRRAPRPRRSSKTAVVPSHAHQAHSFDP